jgi:hypothetical protein
MQLENLHLRGAPIGVAGGASVAAGFLPAPHGLDGRCDRSETCTYGEITRALPQAFSRRFLGRAEMLKNRVVTVR